MRAAIAFSALFMMMTSNAGRNARVASALGGKEFRKPEHLPLTDKPSSRYQPRRWSASGLFQSAIALLFVLLLSTTAQAAKRVALVIGNSAYKHTSELANPRNDATDVAAALKTHGFQVITGFDLDKSALDRKIRDFAVALQGADVGLFFYAGHGLQVSGQNYIVPVDAELTTASALDFEMVSLSLVHRIMEREAQTNILFLDACRNNPLARNLARAMGTRSTEIGRGLAAVESGVGTLISFSTQPGNVALDGTGRNSPFAGALVKHISSANSDLSTMLINVRNDVMRETLRKQVPWEHSALTGQFYFKAQPESKPVAPVSPSWQLSEAERAWILTKDTKSVAVLEAFIARYADAYYAELAREQIAELKARATTAAQAEAKRKAEEAEQQRRAALKAEEERRAKATADAEVKRKAEEGEQQRRAALKAEEERNTKAAAAANRGVDQAELIYSPWTKYCQRGQEANAKQVCLTIKEGRNEPGLPVVAAVLIEPEGDPKKILRVTLPLGMQVVHGTRVIIDQGQPAQRPYVICFTSGCLADYEANADLINRLKKGQRLTVQAINLNGQPIKLTLPIGNEFAKAYDGPPTEPKVFDAQQRKLQEELERRKRAAGGR